MKKFPKFLQELNDVLETLYHLYCFFTKLDLTKNHTRNLLLENVFSIAYDFNRFSFTNLLESAVKNNIIEEHSEIYNIFKSLISNEVKK